MAIQNGHQDLAILTLVVSSCGGFLKSKVYANKSCMILQLQAEIECVIGDIRPQMCKKVNSNFEEHINACRLSAGGHITDIVFYK